MTSFYLLQCCSFGNEMKSIVFHVYKFPSLSLSRDSSRASITLHGLLQAGGLPPKTFCGWSELLTSCLFSALSLAAVDGKQSLVGQMSSLPQPHVTKFVTVTIYLSPEGRLDFLSRRYFSLSDALSLLKMIND